jgi:hypothetical protein
MVSESIETYVDNLETSLRVLVNFFYDCKCDELRKKVEPVAFVADRDLSPSNVYFLKKSRIPSFLACLIFRLMWRVTKTFQLIIV